jgi:hypothetical protein
LIRGREEVDAEVSGSNVVGFLKDQLATSVEARGGAGKREGDDEARQAKNGAVYRSETGTGEFRAFLQVSNPYPAAGF